MTDVRPTMKDVLFRHLRSYANSEWTYISIEKIRRDLQADNLQFTPDLLREYLSEAMAQGVIHNAGRGWYSPLSERAVLDAGMVEPLRTKLAKQFPLLPHYVWSTAQFNPWLHHQLGKTIHFVVVDRDVTADVAAYLRQEGWSLTINPTAKQADEVHPGERSAVIRGIRRDFDARMEPRIETALVDLMLENRRLGLIDESERQDMTRNMLNTRLLDISGLFARLKDHKMAFADLIGASSQPIIAE